MAIVILSIVGAVVFGGTALILYLNGLSREYLEAENVEADWVPGQVSHPEHWDAEPE